MTAGISTKFNFFNERIFTGVKMIRVALLTEKAEIEYDQLLTNPQDLENSIKSLGFGASVVENSSGEIESSGKVELMV